MPLTNCTPWDSATRLTSSGFANSTHSAMPRSAQRIAALIVRGSSPSGNTMRLLASRASSVNWKRNAGGDKRRKRLEASTKPLTKEASNFSLV